VDKVMATGHRRNVVEAARAADKQRPRGTHMADLNGRSRAVQDLIGKKEVER
jgi:hypothetical protein